MSSRLKCLQLFTAFSVYLVIPSIRLSSIDSIQNKISQIEGFKDERIMFIDKDSKDIGKMKIYTYLHLWAKEFIEVRIIGSSTYVL